MDYVFRKQILTYLGKVSAADSFSSPKLKYHLPQGHKIARLPPLVAALIPSAATENTHATVNEIAPKICATWCPRSNMMTCSKFRLIKLCYCTMLQAPSKMQHLTHTWRNELKLDISRKIWASSATPTDLIRKLQNGRSTWRGTKLSQRK